MNSISFKPVVFSHWKRRDGTYPVRIRVTFARQSKYLSTTEVVEPWQMTRSLRLKDQSVIDRMDNLIRTLRELTSRLTFFDLQSMTVADVVDYIEKAGQEKAFTLDFPAFCRQEIAKMGSGAKNYHTALRSFCDFIGTDTFDISLVTSSLMVRYEKHLAEKHGPGARAMSLYTSALAYLHAQARKQFNDEETGNLRIGNPFAVYHCPKQPKGEHRNVAPAIVNLMLLWRDALEGRERLGVDVFLLSFALMGMNAPDLFSCCSPVGGVLTYNRQKTRDRRADGAEMRVRIEPGVQTLFQEYQGPQGSAFCFSLRYSTYVSFERAVNLGLHLFEKRLGLREPLTLYQARHTWATVARSRLCGVNKSDVNDALCHVEAGMRVTDIYAEKDWAVIWAANEKVQSLFAW